MKRKLIFISVFVLLLSCALLLSSCGRAELSEPIELVVANDIHYISPELLGGGGHFYEPTADYDGKTVHYSEAIADAFIAEMIEKKPQAVIIAGDLTLSGAKKSHISLAEKLSSIKEAGIDLLIIPGNHDVDSTSVDYSGDTLVEAEGINSFQFVEIYDGLLPDDLVSRDEFSYSYIYEAEGKLWILMLDVNLYGKGYVKDGTLIWLDEKLAEAKDKGIDVISATHQNLYAHSDMLSFGYTIYNADKLISRYERYGVQCNFSGHIHIQSIKEEKIPEIVSSSMSIADNRYGEIEFNGKGITYTARSVDVAEYARGTGSDNGDLLNFADYSLYYFEEVARNKARESLSGAADSLEQTEAMAEAFAKINSAYFRGRKADRAACREGLELWAEREDFIAQYIDSMLEADGDKLEYRVKFK